MQSGLSVERSWMMISENFSERMKRILLMAPLYRLMQRRFTRADGSKCTGMELGLLTLLFFFEEMLDGKRDAGIRNLAVFLQRETGGLLLDKDEEGTMGCTGYERLARDIVAVFRPPTGRRNEEVFFDWKKGAETHALYSYLKADRADIHSNEQYYILDEQGLELIFATKEYFSEYQLSINQLILRKQLEKGQFVLALRQIEEMRLDVETLRGRMTKIRQEIHRNIVSQDTLSHYRSIVADFNQRLKSEEDSFAELQQFVRDTRDRIRNNPDRDTERRAYENILEVERHLSHVHGLHRELLQEGIDLGTSALAAAEESLYFTGVDSFNYEQEVTSRMFSSPLPVKAARRLVEPFLELESSEVWSLLAIFMPQRLERMEREESPDIFPELEGAEKQGQQLLNVQTHYAAIVQQLLRFLDGRGGTTLKAFVSFLEEQQSPLCQEKQFYVFWILLHRHRVLVIGADGMAKDSIYAAIPVSCPELHSIGVEECDGIIQIGDYSISDMTIDVKYSEGEM